MNDRMPPHNIEAEESVLGAMIVVPSAIPVVLDILEPGDFYRDSHTDLFHAICALWNGDADSVDAVTLSASCPEQKDYIHTLSESVLTASNVRHYAEIVKHLSVCRKLISAGQEITQIGYDDGDDVTTLMDKAESKVFAIRPNGDNDSKRAKDIAHLIYHECEVGDAPKVVPTGFHELDSVCGGLHESNLVLIGARPGVGKTAVGLSIAHNVSKSGTVLFFSLEMSQKELMERLMCSIACVPVTALRNRDLTGDQFANLVRAMPEIENADLRVIDNPSMTMMSMKSKVRQYAAKAEIKLIVVDYLQLMTLGTKTASRFEEVSSISRELKCLARDLKLPILALSQLNRVSTFDGGKPDISHLRESGSLEQDADQVWLLSWPKDPDFGGQDTLTVSVAKNRHGQRGDVDLVWNKRWQRIEAG